MATGSRFISVELPEAKLELRFRGRGRKHCRSSRWSSNKNAKFVEMVLMQPATMPRKEKVNKVNQLQHSEKSRAQMGESESSSSWWRSWIAPITFIGGSLSIAAFLWKLHDRRLRSIGMKPGFSKMFPREKMSVQDVLATARLCKPLVC